MENLLSDHINLLATLSIYKVRYPSSTTIQFLFFPVVAEESDLGFVSKTSFYLVYFCQANQAYTCRELWGILQEFSLGNTPKKKFSSTSISWSFSSFSVFFTLTILSLMFCIQSWNTRLPNTLLASPQCMLSSAYSATLTFSILLSPWVSSRMIQS